MTGGVLYQVEISKSMIGGRYVSTTKERAVIDSGANFVGLPFEAYLLLQGHYLGKGWLPTYNCKESFFCGECGGIDRSSLMITLGGHNFYIPFEELWTREEDGHCVMKAKYDSSGWRLGLPFLRSFLAIIDYDQRTITLIGENKAGPLRHSGNGWVVAAAVLGVALIALIGCCCYRKWRKSKMALRGDEGRMGAVHVLMERT